MLLTFSSGMGQTRMPTRRYKVPVIVVVGAALGDSQTPHWGTQVPAPLLASLSCSHIVMGLLLPEPSPDGERSRDASADPSSEPTLPTLCYSACFCPAPTPSRHLAGVTLSSLCHETLIPPLLHFPASLPGPLWPHLSYLFSDPTICAPILAFSG